MGSVKWLEGVGFSLAGLEVLFAERSYGGDLWSFSILGLLEMEVMIMIIRASK